MQANSGGEPAADQPPHAEAETECGFEREHIRRKNGPRGPFRRWDGTNGEARLCGGAHSIWFAATARGRGRRSAGCGDNAATNAWAPWRGGTAIPGQCAASIAAPAAWFLGKNRTLRRRRASLRECGRRAHASKSLAWGCRGRRKECGLRREQCPR